MNFEVRACRGDVDEMIIRTGFAKRIISSVVEKMVRKKLGKNVEMNLHDLHVEIGEKARVSLSIDICMDRGELEKLIMEKVFG